MFIRPHISLGLRDDEIRELVPESLQINRNLVFPDICNFQSIGNGPSCIICIEIPSIYTHKFRHLVPNFIG